MKNIFLSSLFIVNFLIAACPDGFYEDDCGNCWMPYCYDVVTHIVQYDLAEDECNDTTETWVIPGNGEDLYFNNYCDVCPDGFYADDCNHCWPSFCYSFFEEGLDGDPTHSVYYDLTLEECENYGFGYYMPDHPSNPYWNSNCSEDYDYEIHAGNYYYDPPYLEIEVGSSVMWLNDGGYHNVNGETNSITEEPFNNPESFYIGASAGVEIGTYTFTVPGTYNYDCSIMSHAEEGMVGTIVVVQDQLNVCGTGDSNQDNGVDVLDVVLVVDFVLGNNTPNDDQLCASDMNADGGIDVLDVVQIVDIILGNRGFKANTAEILINGSDVKFDANGIVDAFQIKLSHNGPIELELTDDALVSKYRTVGNTTTLIIVSPESDYLFTSDNHYIIEEALAATTDGYIDVTMDIPLDYSVGNAYPNPFNPTTNLSIDLNTNAKVNISIYNTMGQLMDVIVNDNLSSGYHTYVWDANDAPSGLYLIQTDVNSNISTQKVLLIK